MPFPVELIPSEDSVFRRVFHFNRIGEKERKFPNDSCFELRPGEDGLSVNWDKYFNVEDNFLLIAISHNKKGEFWDHTLFKLFKFPVAFLRELEEINDVEHKPICNGNPAPVGKPNNRAHSIVIYENDPEIWLKLSDFCNKNFDLAHCNLKMKSIESQVKELREMLDDTRFHRH